MISLHTTTNSNDYNTKRANLLLALEEGLATAASIH